MRPLPFDPKILKDLVTQSRHLNIAPLFFNQFYPGEEKHPVSRILRRIIPEGIEYLRIMEEQELCFQRSEIEPPTTEKMIHL